jgi:pSer/pThr/pTyr-binding forkhead associated (FHA) protein
VRLSFPKGEHPDVLVPPGELTIGSAEGNAIVLKADAIKPQHASIVVDSRGFTLIVRTNDAHTHVNARPVRERAILRLGDVISLDSINVVLKPDRDEAIRPPPAATDDLNLAKDDPQRSGPPRVVLRAVSGPYFGKAIPITGKLTVGRGDSCDLVLDDPEMGPSHAEIRVSGGSISLRDLGSSQGSQVNGVPVRDAQLFSGDQISFHRSRFLVEAPGMPTRKDIPTVQGVVIPTHAPVANSSGPEPRVAAPQVTQTMRAIRLEPPTPNMTPSAPASTPTAQPVTAPAPGPSERAAEPAYNPWFLIAIGAMIAVGITLLLMARAG